MKHIAAFLTLIATVAFVISPLVTDPFMGFRADQLPVPQIKPPIQPAGYAFSIWGLIYGWLLVSAIFGIWQRRDDAGWDRARWPLIVSLGIGAFWLSVANASAIWATVLIFAMAASAIVGLMRSPRADRWWLRAPVAIYAGWLTAASFVSLGSTMAGYGVLVGSIGWAWIGITGALVVTITVMMLQPRSPEYGVTVIWALIGIIVANGTATVSVTVLSLLGITLVAALTAINMRRTAS